MPAEVITRIVDVSGHSLRLQVAADPERVLDEALSAGSAGDSDADPYWALLWDAAIGTAACVLEYPWNAPLSVLELGCGTGLAGVSALIAGHRVTFSDRVPEAVALAVSNAAMNGFADADGCVLDWHRPQDRRYELLIASDVLYDSAHHQPLLNTLDRMLADDGTVWIGDTGRHHSATFMAAAMQAGWRLQLRDASGLLPASPLRPGFRLLVLTRAGAAGAGWLSDTTTGSARSTDAGVL